MTEDRFRRLEDFSEISLELHRMAETNRQLMLENQRHAEERQRHAEERLRQIEGGQQQIQELLARLSQTVALMQADIVRLDQSQ